MEPIDIKKFINDEHELSWENIIAKLSLIAAIKEGQKIDVASMQLIDAGYMNRAFRTLFARGESRECTMTFIKTTIADALELCEKYTADNDDFYRGLGRELYVRISDATSGLRALKKT